MEKGEEREMKLKTEKEIYKRFDKIRGRDTVHWSDDKLLYNEAWLSCLKWVLDIRESV